MIDWGKYWTRDAALVNRILANKALDFKESHSTKTGEITEYPKFATWKCWEFEIKSPTWLEVRGSLHKYWNGGASNENDFKLHDLYVAVANFCKFLQVSPYDLTVHNLEFGVNIRPAVDASAIMRDVVCFKNRMSKNPIDNDKGYFIEFETDEYYFKIYDKGLQAQEVWKKKAGNILRVEVKATNSGFLQFAHIHTMADLLNPGNLQLLGRKLDSVFKHIVFDDDTIDTTTMSAPDKKVYLALINPRIWAKYWKKKTTTIRAREHRFRAIVAKYGAKKHNLTLSKLVHSKWQELLIHTAHTKQEIKKFLKSCKL